MLQQTKKSHCHLIALLCIAILSLGMVLPLSPAVAATSDAINTLTASTTVGGYGNDVLVSLFTFLYEKLLAPILNLLGLDKSSPVVITPLPGSPDGSSAILQGKVIVLDPGHGGNNPGATGNNLREANVNLAVAQQLRAKLQAAGAKVIMTRDSDRNVVEPGSSLEKELQARVDIAERQKADIFVSLHSNSNTDESINGAMTFYGQNKSPRLAEKIQNALIAATGAADKGVAPADFYVLCNTSMPAALVEMGFVSNRQEAAKLGDSTYRSQIAQGIFNGIVAYFR